MFSNLGLAPQPTTPRIYVIARVRRSTSIALDPETRRCVFGGVDLKVCVVQTHAILISGFCVITIPQIITQLAFYCKVAKNRDETSIPVS